MEKLRSVIDQYRGLSRENYILFLGRVVTNLGAMVWPLITLILSDKMGLSATATAVALAVFFALTIPSNLLGGRIADKFDKKMNIVYFDLVSIVLFILCAFLPMVWPVMVMMCAAALAQNMENASYDALVADITPTEDRTRAYSLSYMGENLGLVLAPTIGGLLFENYLWLAFLISGLSIACSTVLIFFLVKDTTPRQSTLRSAELYEKSREDVSVRTILRENPVIVLYILVIALAKAIYSQSGYLLPLDLEKIHPGAGAAIYGTLMSANCILVVVLMPIVTRVSRDTRDTVRLLAGNLLTFAGTALFFAVLGHIPWYYAAIFIFTVGEVCRSLTNGPYLTIRVPASHRGRLSAVRNVAASVLLMVVQLLCGRIYDLAGSAAAWYFVIALCVILIVITVVLIFADRKAYPEIVPGSGEAAEA